MTNRSLPVLTLLAALALAAPALAQTKPAPAPAQPAAPAGPKSIGSFDDWQAATYSEGGQTVCYAFVKARKSDPKIQGRGEVVLTVTQRGTGRDSVALSAGFDYAANATAEVQVDARKDEFYTAKRSAFARDGKALVAALLKAKTITATSPHPNPKTPKVVDTFSPKGFAKAYEAINKACPPK